MPSLKDIRSRIDSTKNTQQITKAMKMVSAAKLRRAQQSIVNLRPYAHSLLHIIADIAVTHRVSHPLLERVTNPKNILVVVISSDRGLCAAFNTNVNKAAFTFMRENKANYDKMDFVFVGKKTAEFFRKREIKPKSSILNLAKEVSYGLAAGVASQVMEAYKTGEYDEVRFIYNEFKSVISQVVRNETVLPIDIEAESTLSKGASGFPPDMIFEPKPEFFIEQLIEKHFNIQVYRIMSESVAAEHGARMTSMENATKNAGEMIRGLTLTYNKIRQASITKELIEITTGAEALRA